MERLSELGKKGFETLNLRRLFLHLLLEDLTPQMAVAKKIFLSLRLKFALIGILQT